MQFVRASDLNEKQRKQIQELNANSENKRRENARLMSEQYDRARAGVTEEIQQELSTYGSGNAMLPVNRTRFSDTSPFAHAEKRRQLEALKQDKDTYNRYKKYIDSQLSAYSKEDELEDQRLTQMYIDRIQKSNMIKTTREAEEYKKRINEGMEKGDYVSTISNYLGNQFGLGVEGFTRGVLGASYSLAGTVQKMFGDESGANDTLNFAKRQQSLYDTKSSIMSDIDDKGLQFAGKVTNQLGNQVPSIALNLVAPGTGLATLGVSAGGRKTVETLNEDNSNLLKALLTGTIVGGTEVLTEKMFSGNALTRGMSSTPLDEMATNAVSKVGNPYLRRLAGLGMDVLGENAEELVSNVVERGTDALINGKDFGSISELWNEGKETVGTTTATTIVMAMLGLGGETYRNANQIRMNRDSYNTSVKNANLDVNNKGIKALFNSANNKELTPMFSSEIFENSNDSYRVVEMSDGSKILAINPDANITEVNEQISKMSNKQLEQITTPMDEDIAEGIRRTAENNYLKEQQQESNRVALQESARQYGINPENETIKQIQSTLSDRGIRSYFDETFFDSPNVGALYRLSRNEDGSYSREIVFNPNANEDTIIQEMAVHELTHDIVASKTDVSQSMFQDVMNYLKQDTENFNAVRDSVVNAYMQKYANSDVDVNSPDFQNMIDEELVAKTLQAKLGNQEFINKLHNENRTLFQKFVDWINDKVESFKNRNNAEYKFWKDIQNKFVEAYKNSEFRPGKASSELYSNDTNLPTADNQGRTLSKEQQEYFKDSKARDENGNLIEMYHGTNEDFTVFDNSGKGKRFTNFGAEYDADVKGFFFTSNKSYAEEFGNVKPYYLNTKKILKLDNNIEDLNKIFQPMLEDMLNNQDITKTQYDAIIENGTTYKRFIDEEGIDWDIIDEEAFNNSIKIMRELGYDSIAVNEGNDNTSIMVFNSNQIKNVDNLNPTSNPDIRYSIDTNETTQDNIQDKINQAMTMKEAKKMIEMAFIDNGIYDWYDGKYSDADEWLRGEGIDEVETYLDNTSSVMEKFLNPIYNKDESYGNDYMTSDILQAYLDGTLTGSEQANKTKRLDTSIDTGYKDTRFYAPQDYKEGIELYNTASQRVTNSNKQEVYKARADFIINAHNPNFAESIGLTSQEVNQKVKSWANYPAKTMELSRQLNEGVARQNQWTGLENSSIVNTIAISNEELSKMVKDIQGDSSNWQRQYITSTMLALDTHIDYSNVTFKFDQQQELSKRHALGEYQRETDTILIGGGYQNTVAHEIGHYIDSKWARDLGINAPYLSETWVKTDNLNEQQKQFVQNFQNFIKSISEDSYIGSKYGGRDAEYWQHNTEIFARFVGRFTEWTKNQATNNRYGYEEKHYQDNFTEAQYREFVKLLQEKSALETSARETTTANSDIRYSVNKPQGFDEYIANRVGKEGTRTSYKDLGLTRKQIIDNSKAKANAKQILPTGKKSTFYNDTHLATDKESFDNYNKLLKDSVKKGKEYTPNEIKDIIGIHSDLGIEPIFTNNNTEVLLEYDYDIGKNYDDLKNFNVMFTEYLDTGDDYNEIKSVQVQPNANGNYTLEGIEKALTEILTEKTDLMEGQLDIEGNQVGANLELPTQEETSGNAEIQEENNENVPVLPTQGTPILPPIDNNNIAETNEDGTGKQRKAYKSIIESEYMSDEAKAISKKLMGSDTYIPDSNKAQLQRADERIDRNGVTNELATLETNALEGKTIKADDIAVGDRLIQYYSKIGDSVNLERAIRATAMAGTQAGRAVQAFSMLRHQSPNGMVVWIQNSVDKLNSKINGNNKYNFTQDMQQKILNSTEENFETNVEEVLKELGNQVPKSLLGKLDEWRYFSMLANPKTHIRNIIGNLTMGQVQKVKNKVAGAIESATLGTETGRNVLSKIAGRDITEGRTHSWKPTTQENRAWAKEFLNDKDINSRLGIGSDKYTPKQGIEKYQRTFKSDALENTLGKMFDINSKLLEVEDNFGLKNAYVTAFADYMDANNLTKATATSKQIAQAQKHAIEEAQRATFHQANSIATAIQTIENKNLATKTFVGAVLPFKKTPMNVAKTGFDYSPAGLLKSITYDTVQLRKGNIDVNTWIDNISQGLTGTGIAVIGYALAEAGILKASGGDDDKEKFEEATGSQNYAIKIGNNTYSLDWLAPTGIPLFIGAELSRIADDTAEKTGKSKNQALNSITNVLDATATAMNPMSEMSMISGLTSSLKSYSQGTGQSLAELTANAGKSYVTQFVPTALGQIAKSTDKYERSTTTTESEVGSKAIDSAKNQIMSKIPGLRQLLPVKTDVWGNPVETKGYVENAILPWNRQELQNDKVNQELTRLYDETGDDSVFPATSFNKTLTIDKEKYRMTNQEFQDYKANYGKKAHSLLSQLIKSDDYKGMTAEQKQTAIEEVYKYAKVTSNSKYATSNDIEYDNSTMNTIKTIKDNGGSEVDYFKYKGITKGMSTEAEKMSAIRNSDFSLGSKKAIYSSTIGADDSKYNVLKNTGINIDTYLDYKSQKFASDETGAKKDKVFEYVNNSPMSYEQRLLTLGMEYSLSDAEQRRIVDIVSNMGLTRDEQLQIFSKMKGFKVNGNNVTW